MRALGAVEEVFCFVVFGFGSAGVAVGVGDFRGSAESTYVDAVPMGDETGERGGEEDVARRREGLVGWEEGEGGKEMERYPYSAGMVRATAEDMESWSWQGGTYI